MTESRTEKSELHGYSLPFSPTGRSSLVPSPPWYFSGEVLMVEYRADPDAVRSFLPHELDATEFGGLSAAIFGDWQSCTSEGTELLDPVRSQYREFYIALACRWRGDLMARCPYCWVDKDFSLVRGLIQGYPKKMGSIGMTRAFSTGRATPTAGLGGRFAGTLAAGDRRLVEAQVTLERPAEAPALMTAPLAHTRHFPSWDTLSPDVSELVTGGGSDQTVTDIWSGTAQLEFLSSPAEDLHLLAPVEVGRGYRLSFSETISPGRLLSHDGR